MLASLGGAVEIIVTDLHRLTTRVPLSLPSAAGAGPFVDEGHAGTIVTVLPGLPDGRVTVSDDRFEVLVQPDNARVLCLRPWVALDDDREATLHVTVSALAAGGMTLTMNIALSVREVNLAPIGPAGATVWAASPVEAGQDRIALCAPPVFVDPEGQPLVYQLQDAPTKGALFLDGVACNPASRWTPTTFNGSAISRPPGRASIRRPLPCPTGIPRRS